MLQQLPRCNLILCFPCGSPLSRVARLSATRRAGARHSLGRSTPLEYGSRERLELHKRASRSYNTPSISISQRYPGLDYGQVVATNEGSFRPFVLESCKGAWPGRGSSIVSLIIRYNVRGIQQILFLMPRETEHRISRTFLRRRYCGMHSYLHVIACCLLWIRPPTLFNSTMLTFQ